MPTYTSSTPLVLDVDDASVEVLEGGLPKITIGDAGAAQAVAEEALADAAAAQQQADDALALAGVAVSSADIARVAAFAAVPAASGFYPWGISGHWGRLTHQPHVLGTLSTSTAEPGRIVYFPFDPMAVIPVTQWAVEVTNTPVGTSLTVSVARYSVNADGSPNALIADYSANAIKIPNSPAALVASSAFASVEIPVGHWMLAVLFLGTAGGTPPVLRTVTGHPSVGAATMASLNVNGGYRSPDTTNVGFPSTAAIGADQGRGGILLYARRA